MTASALFPGETWHRRLRPVEHFLRYQILMILIDLDEAEAISNGSRYFGYNRSRVLAFNDRDHGDGSATPLRAQVEAHLAAAGLPTGGAIRVLGMPRIFGQVFNPLTIYYCHAPRAAEAPPIAVLYEVNNTFGQRHSYLLRAENDSGRTLSECDKQFYVSPFMDMALQYRFRLTQPPVSGANAPLSVDIEVNNTDGARVLTAAFTGRRQEMTDAALLRAALSYPLLMLKVVGAIHWEAMKLWIKGMRLRPRPPPPAEPVTTGQNQGAAARPGL